MRLLLVIRTVKKKERNKKKIKKNQNSKEMKEKEKDTRLLTDSTRRNGLLPDLATAAWSICGIVIAGVTSWLPFPLLEKRIGLFEKRSEVQKESSPLVSPSI